MLEARGTGLVPGQGTEIAHAVWCGQKIKKRSQGSYMKCQLDDVWLWPKITTAYSWFKFFFSHKRQFSVPKEPSGIISRVKLLPSCIRWSGWHQNHVVGREWKKMPAICLSREFPTNFPFHSCCTGQGLAMRPHQLKENWELYSSFFFFCLYHAAYGILVPLPGIKPVPSVLESRFLTSGPPEKFQLLGLLRGVGDTGSLISTSCHECSSHFPLFFSPPGLLFHCCTCL